MAKSFAELLEEARLARGMTGNGVDSACGFRPGTYSKWKNGLRGKRVSADAITKLSGALGINEAWLQNKGGPRDLATPGPSKLPFDAVVASMPSVSAEAVATVRALAYSQRRDADPAFLKKMLADEMKKEIADVKAAKAAQKPGTAASVTTKKRSVAPKEPAPVVERAPKSRRRTGTQ